MSTSLLVLSALLGAAPAVPRVFSAAGALEQVRTAFERRGRVAPVEDDTLGAAATLLARRALAEGVDPAASVASISDAVSRSGGFLPNPHAWILRANRPEALRDALARKKDLAAYPATRVGAGWAESGGRYALALLMVERKAVLDPFPHHLPRTGLSQTLSGKLLPPLSAPELFVTRPNGEVERPTVQRVGDDGFSTPLHFGAPGHYAVEVVGHGPAGPEVAALFSVWVGEAPPVARAPERISDSEPAPEDASAPRILARIDRLRASAGLPPLTDDPALDALARAYSARMAHEHFMAHVDPSGETLSDRLRRAGYAFETAGENLASAPSARAAESSLERSPGHRANLLEPRFDRAGVGIAVEHVDGVRQVLITELFARATHRNENALSPATSRSTGKRTSRVTTRTTFGDPTPRNPSTAPD